MSIFRARLWCLAALTSLPLSAETLTGTQALILADNSGQEIQIGTINFETREGTTRYRLDMDHHKFTDYFLSMKEMKCLEGPELWCHLPYPYENPRTVSTEMTEWVSHDLLFMFKKLDEFGANFWNGIYYTISVEEGELVGSAQAVDLNLLASPPDDLSTPPIGEYDRDEIDPKQRWLPHLIIR